MAEIDSDNILKETIESLDRPEKVPVNIPNMYGLNTEYATANRWIGYFPIQNVLGREYNNLELNLVRFSIPQMVMGSTTTSFKGYQIEYPTKVMDPDSKEINIEYLIDAKWENYKALFNWVSGIEGNINPIVGQNTTTGISTKDFIDCRIWLIDHFKNRIIDFVFHNCWIKKFNDLALEASNTNEITHSFTMAYSNFEIAKASL